MRETISSLRRPGLDGEEVLHRSLVLLNERLRVDGAWVHKSDPATLVWTSYAATHEDNAALFVENEFLDEDFAKFARLAQRPDPVALLTQETEGEPWRSARYRTLLKPAGFEHELRVALVAGGVCWGGVCLGRSDDLGDFSTAEMERARELAPHIAEAIRAAALRTPPPPAEAPGPGTIVLDGSGLVVSLSSEATYWLAHLGGSAVDLPYVVHAVAARTRACACGTPALVPRAGIRAIDGRWIELHGSALRPPGEICADDAASDDGTGLSVAITIGAARPRTLAPLLVEAFELSARERDVLALLLRGHTPDEIARRLVISRHTVGDHVKAIYVKADVTSRSELSARLLALNIPVPSEPPAA